MKRKLKRREKDFCAHILTGRTPEQAARLAGYRGELSEFGGRLLCEERILEEIDRLAGLKKRVLVKLATLGYGRLAFGDVSDAVELLYLENPGREKLKQMDLSMVAEIKKPKDGALELKFYDRLKALEKLGEENDGSESPLSLYEAIGRQAQRLGGDGGD